MTSRRARQRLDKRETALDLARTGYPAGMLQDDSRELSRWFASKPEAPLLVREQCLALARICGHGTSFDDVADEAEKDLEQEEQSLVHPASAVLFPLTTSKEF